MNNETQKAFEGFKENIIYWIEQNQEKLDKGYCKRENDEEWNKAEIEAFKSCIKYIDEKLEDLND